MPGIVLGRDYKTVFLESMLTFTSMIYTTSESLKAKKVSIFQHFSFYDQLKFYVQLSRA